MILFRSVIVLFFLVTSPYLSSQTVVEGAVDEEKPSLSFEMKENAERSSLPGVGQLSLSLLLVIALAFAVVFLLKRFGYGEKKIFPDSSTIKVLASKKLSIKSTIHYVDVENTQYLIVERDNAVSITPHILRKEAGSQDDMPSHNEISSKNNIDNKP